MTVAVLCTGVLLVAACGSSSPKVSTTTAASGSATTAASGSATTAAGGSSTGVDATLAAMVPAKLKQAGKVIVATDASYAPNEFFASDNKTIEGMDVDLGEAIGNVLGVKFVFTEATFDSILAGLGSRYDIGMSSFTDNKAREQQVDMVDYFTAGEAFMVQKGKNQDITSLAALCGKTVAVESGTTELTDAQTQSKACTAAGKAKVTVQSYDTQSQANLALSTGRADVSFADTPVNEYQAKVSNGAFEVIGSSIENAPYGIAVPKGAAYKGLAQAILGAIQKLNSDGTYTQILTKWGVQSGAISDFKLNGATS